METITDRRGYRQGSRRLQPAVVSAVPAVNAERRYHGARRTDRCCFRD